MSLYKDPGPVIDRLLVDYFETLEQIDQLEEVVSQLVSDHTNMDDVSWNWHLVSESRRLGL